MPYRLLLIAFAFLAAITVLPVPAPAADEDESVVLAAEEEEDGLENKVKELTQELAEIKLEIEDAKAEGDEEAVAELTSHAKNIAAKLPMIKKIVALDAEIEKAEVAGDDDKIELLEAELDAIHMKLKVMNWSETLEDLKNNQDELTEARDQLKESLQDGDQKRAATADELIKQVAPLTKKITALLKTLKTQDFDKIEAAHEKLEPLMHQYERAMELFYLDLELEEAWIEGDKEAVKELTQKIENVKADKDGESDKDE